MNADSYYEPPEPDYVAYLEGLDQDLDMLVTEYAEMCEIEIFARADLDRGGEPIITLTRIAKDGERLYGGIGFPMEFDALDDLRKWVELRFPIPSQTDN